MVHDPKVIHDMIFHLLMLFLPHPYLQADVLRQYPTTDKLEEVINSVKKLADRLAVESSFGRGDSNITDCEKNIATLLNSLSTFAENFQVGDSAENAEKIMDVVKNLNSLLSLRTNMEKRR